MIKLLFLKTCNPAGAFPVRIINRTAKRSAIRPPLPFTEVMDFLLLIIFFDILGLSRKSVTILSSMWLQRHNLQK